MSRLKILTIGLALALLVGCGINSVTRAQLEVVKAGDTITYRYQKEGKSWFYTDRVTRVDDQKVYYNPSRSESTSGKDHRLQDYDLSKELSIEKAEFLKFETEQGDERKVVIWID